MLNIDENDPHLLEIFNHYGEEHQRFKCAEECMELMAATFRYAQIDFDLSLTEEARNVIAGMIEIFDNPEESRKRIYSEMDRKIQRQIDRIKGE